MVWCISCAKETRAERDDTTGITCCTSCGRVLDDTCFSSDPTFSKDSSGQSQVSGNIIRGGQYSSYSRLDNDSYQHHSVSHERTLDRGRNEIGDIADSLSISGRDDAVNAAHRLYVLAVEKSFTRGRRTQQVAASCLYIVCREENKPYLLIDFSDSLQISVYVLGAVFLQLCKLLRLEEHPIIQKPVDPSLFIHRFTDQLLAMRSGFGNKQHAIANMALRIVASMKRDWIQTGRRPSGICGAAIFIAAHVHGLECTKGEVVSVVHVCENTLSKRLKEFGDTENGSLTPEEFEIKARESEMHTIVEAPVNKGHEAISELLCEHKDQGVVHFAHGLCRNCYDEFVKVSGGIDGGSDPPAFQQAEKRRLLKAKRRKFMLAALDEIPGDDELLSSYLKKSRKRMDSNLAGCSESSPDSSVTESRKTATQQQETDNLEEENETLSDIDDDEVNAYINSEEEVRLKTVVWTEMNKEYVEEMEAKEAAVAASEAAEAAELAAIASAGTPAEIAAAAAAAAVLKCKRIRKTHKRETQPPAESAAEAARQMFERRRMGGSKVNLDVLESLFEGKKEEGTSQDAKQAKSVHWADGEVAKAEEPEADEEEEADGEEDYGTEEMPSIYDPQQEEEEYYEEY